MRVENIQKRNGVLVPFNAEKIYHAILAAYKATYGSEIEYVDEIEEIHTIVMKRVERERGVLTVERVQDIVEEVIGLRGNIKVLLKYHTYRLEQEGKRHRENNYSSVLDIIDNYISEKDWEVKENSNMGYSLQGLNHNVVSHITREYWKQRIYPADVQQVVKDNKMHIHDMDLLATYCCGWDLEQLLQEGFRGARYKTESGPAKTFKAALGQVVNFLYTLQGESAGAQAFSNVDTLLAPFIRFDGLTYKQVYKEVRGFLFNLNIPTRVGFQAPFTNVTLDLVIPKFLENLPVICGGKRVEGTRYGDYQKEVDMFNRAFCEAMIAGDAKGNQFPYPIPTYNITKEFAWDSEIADLIFDMTAKYGIPYFANFINADMKPEDVRSMCPLTGDTEVLVKSKQSGIRVAKIVEIINGMSQKGTEYQVYSNGEWCNARPVKTPLTKILKIKLSNGCEVKMGEDHLQPTKENGVLSAKDLKVGMMLPFNNQQIEGYTTISENDITSGTDYRYVAIAKIEEVALDSNTEYLYCFEVDNKDRLFMLANGLITHNCRLRLDNRELMKKGGGMFGANPKTGSIGVVTLNLPLLGYLHKVSDTSINFDSDMDVLLQSIKEVMLMAKKSLDVKREKLEKLTEHGLYPYIKHYMQSVKDARGGYWAQHFSTIGLIGMNECILNFTNGWEDITTEKGQRIALEIMMYMRSVLEDWQEDSEEEVMYNLEATPGEGTTYRLASRDKEKYGDIRTAGKLDPYYTNSTQLPVDYTTDIFDALTLQEDLQVLYTGGTVFHGMLGEALPDREVAKELVQKMLQNTRIPYITLSPTFSVCPAHGYLKGEHFECPTCGAKSEVYARVVGFYRPVNNWNLGKREEYRERVEFVVGK